MKPLYIETYERGLLEEKIQRALVWMKKCTLCPRMCKVDRTTDEKGFCLIGRSAVVASYGPHFGEESPLVGRYGSGTIFFSGCNLMCTFCQNYDISHTTNGYAVSPVQLAEIMVELQKNDCHNINFVTPTHVVPQILESLPHAIKKGLSIPLVYNCGGYERVSTLKILSGVIDIYMPDFKFWSPESASKWCSAPDYPRRVREALREMHRQVGDLEIKDGIALRGLLVRHLVMPEGLEETREIMMFIAKEISPHTYVNVMNQYRPCGTAYSDPQLRRRITSEEFIKALQYAKDAGLLRLDERRTSLFWFV